MFGKKQCRRDEETVPAALLFPKRELLCPTFSYGNSRQRL